MTYTLHTPDLTGWWSWEHPTAGHNDGFTSARDARQHARDQLGPDAKSVQP